MKDASRQPDHVDAPPAGQGDHALPRRERRRIDGDAAWAHNQWPVIGLVTGGIVGGVLGFSFAIGLLYTALAGFGGAVLGLLTGYAAASIIYRARD